MKKGLLLVCALLIITNVWAQKGQIGGTVLNSKGLPATGTSVIVTEDGIEKAIMHVNEDGSYLTQPMNAGRYKVKMLHNKHRDAIITGVLLCPDKISKVDMNLELRSSENDALVIKAYRIALIDRYSTNPVLTTYTVEQLDSLERIKNKK